LVFDNGPEKQSKLLEKYPIDYHIKCNKNIGVGCSRNVGGAIASKEFVAFVDGDLTFNENWLSNSIDVIENNEQKIVATPYKCLHMAGRRFKGRVNGATLWTVAAGGCLVMRRESFYEIGLWDMSGRIGWNYCHQVNSHGYRYALIDSPRIAHRGSIRSYHLRDDLIDGNYVQNVGKQKLFWNVTWGRTKTKNIDNHGVLFKELRNIISKFSNVVDLGCGITNLYDNYKGKVTGVDISETAISYMKDNYPNGEWIIGDVQNTGIINEKYECVLLVSIIEHFANFDNVLLEAKRLVDKKGRIILVVPFANFDRDHRHPRWTKDKIEKEIGCILGKIEIRPFNKWWIVKTQELI